MKRFLLFSNFCNLKSHFVMYTSYLSVTSTLFLLNTTVNFSSADSDLCIEHRGDYVLFTVSVLQIHSADQILTFLMFGAENLLMFVAFQFRCQTGSQSSVLTLFLFVALLSDEHRDRLTLLNPFYLTIEVLKCWLKPSSPW